MVPEKPSYFSRFAVKFAEILGAGIATAVSGYLVAHLGGYLSWPTKAPVPTVALEAPAGGNARTADRPRDRATASTPAEARAAPDDRAKEPAHGAAKPVEVSTPVTTAAVPADNDDKRSRGGVPSRKPAADAHTVKPTPHEAAEAKAQALEAVEDQVRAALANVDASRTPAPSAPPPAATTPAPQTAAIPQPSPIPAPSSPVPSATAASAASSAVPPVAVTPVAIPPAAPPLDIQNAAPATPTLPSAPVAVSASAQQTPAEPAPLIAVEIKSRPVAGVGETSPAAQATAEANNEPDGKAKGEPDKSFFSAIAHLPDLLRTNVHAPSGDPPRPPMPVGE